MVADILNVLLLFVTLANRHTICGARGRKLEDYQRSDESLTLTFGVSASMASIVIVVIYLIEEVFARQIYTTPGWLWIAPIGIFLFKCQIWALSHGERMTDDPVAFALRDRVCLGIGFSVAVSILVTL